jgi:predicted acetyltransferase
MNIKLLKQENRSDLESLMTLLDIYYSSEVKDRKTISKKFIEKEKAWGYFLNNELVGYVLIEYFAKDHMNFTNSVFLSELFVLEKHRRKKIGLELVNYILNLEFPSIFSSIFVTHSPEEVYLTNFYKKCGFKFNRILNSGNVALEKVFDSVTM